MSTLGYIFWGVLISIVGAGFFLEKKFKVKPPEKTKNQLENESIAYKHASQNQYGGGGQG